MSARKTKQKQGSHPTLVGFIEKIIKALAPRQIILIIEDS